jgi:acyl carrier protein
MHSSSPNWGIKMTTRRHLLLAAAATAALALPLAAAPAMAQKATSRDPAAVERRLLSYLQRRLGADPSETTRDHRLIDDLGIDEHEFVNLILFVEETWALEIPDEDAAQLHTLGDLVDYIVGW